MSVIEIIAKAKNGKVVLLDDASNKKDARQQVSYWQRLKGKGWKVFSKASQFSLDKKVKVCYGFYLASWKVRQEILPYHLRSVQKEPEQEKTVPMGDKSINLFWRARQWKKQPQQKQW